MTPLTRTQWLIAIWGAAGVSLLLLRPIIGLSALSWHALSGDLGPAHWLFLAVWLPFMVFVEGVRGFQKRAAPRVVARALYLARHPRPLHVIFAPIYCTALMHVRRSTLIARWILISFIIGMIVSIRFVPAPWRGLTDAGVVLGLGWGCGSILVVLAGAMLGRMPEADLALPGTPAPPRGRARRQGAS